MLIFTAKTGVAAILPITPLGLFHHPALLPMAQEMEHTLNRIIRDLK